MEAGLPGGIFLVLWLVGIIIAGFQVLKEKISHPFINNFTFGIMGGIIGIMIIYTFSPDIHVYQLQYQIGLFSGILLAEKKMLKNAKIYQMQMGRALKVIKNP